MRSSMRLMTASSPRLKNIPLLVRILGASKKGRACQSNDLTRRQEGATTTHSLSTLLPELLSTTDERSRRGVACLARPSTRQCSVLGGLASVHTRAFCFRCSHSSSVRKL